ncbi:indole-3-glycerol phosphate synthase TrpC [Candidatus Saganbacteria bacterium]|nr:indole-3-glycerol phosphate synthase TrpC [Candidatus Saganbacteria bacterium]
MILDEIIENKKGEVAVLKDQLNRFIKLPNIEDLFPPLLDFEPAIRKDKINLIAEVKKASPSSGVIVEDFDPIKIAETYKKSGAAAVSVITDAKFFQGMLAYLKNIKETLSIPVLRKDFIIDEAQILESRMAGSDAVLLIARILDANQLKMFLEKSASYKLSSLVEVHDEKDVEKALSADPRIIGINNRDLDTLEVDFNTSFNLVSKYPELRSKVLVSESGINSRSQIDELKSAGFSAVLIGESLLKSRDVPQKIRELFA